MIRFDGTFDSPEPGMFEQRLNDVIALLSGERAEFHPGERFVAHAQFFAWASVPHMPAIVEYMQLVAAARLYRFLERDLIDIGEDKKRYMASVAARYLAPGYVSRTVLSTNDLAFDAIGIDLLRSDSQLAAEIVRFFVQVDQNRNCGLVAPTMNRAMRFVGENAFDFFEEPTSPTKIKAVWSDVARTAPILAADTYLDTLCTFSFPYSTAFVAPVEPSTIKRIFGSAKFLQSRCRELMHPDTLRKVVFPDWPDFIDEVPVEYGIFTDSQAEAIKDYRVVI